MSKKIPRINGDQRQKGIEGKHFLLFKNKKIIERTYSYIVKVMSDHSNPPYVKVTIFKRASGFLSNINTKNKNRLCTKTC